MSLWPELKSSNSIQTITLDDCLFHGGTAIINSCFLYFLCLSLPPSLPVPHDSLVHCCCVDVQPCSCHCAPNQPQGAPTIYLAPFLFQCAYHKCSRCSGPAALHHQCSGGHKWGRREARALCMRGDQDVLCVNYPQHHSFNSTETCCNWFACTCTLNHAHLSRVLHTYVVWVFTSGLCQWTTSTCPSLYRTNCSSRTVFRTITVLRIVRAIPPGPDWLYSVHLLYTYLAIGHCGIYI